MNPLLLPILLLASASGDDIAPDQVGRALVRGEAILLEMQESLDEDDRRGEWPYEGVYRTNGEIPVGYRIGGTSIAAWSLLELEGWDEAPKRHEAVVRALDFVIETLDHPLMSIDFEGRYDVRGWGHTYALTFLLRLRELERVPEGFEEEVDDRIRWLVRAIQERAIGKKGGWNYSRGRGTNGSPPSTFMTAATLQALFAAEHQGEKLKPRVIRSALEALEEARVETGAFQYASNPERMTGQRGEEIPGSIGRMPICETTLLLAGRGSPEAVKGALDSFFEHWEWLEKRRKKTGTHEPPYAIAPYYFYFAHVYAAQAIEALPEDARPAYRQQLYRLLWQVREESGGWNDRIFPRSENFGTATTLIALRLPEIGCPEARKTAKK